MLLARSLLFTTLMILSVPFYALVVLLLAPFPHATRYKVAVAWVRANLTSLRWLCGLTYEVSGRENIPADACVVMLKHSSAMETLVELELFPRQTWALKRELMWLPFFGWAMALLKPIAVHRGAGRSAVNQLVQKGAERIRDGVFVMIFPEGTRVAAGETGRYGIGGAALAVRAQVPIVPVAAQRRRLLVATQLDQISGHGEVCHRSGNRGGGSGTARGYGGRQGLDRVADGRDSASGSASRLWSWPRRRLDAEAQSHAKSCSWLLSRSRSQR